MPGSDEISSEISGQVVEHIKFNPLVTASAGIGCPSIAIFIDEVIDDLAKLFGIVEGVKGDIEAIGYSPGIDGIFDGTTSTAFLSSLAPITETQEGSDDLVPFIFQELGCYAGIYPTAHSHQYLGH
jgi:tryptophan synthase beta subunit